MAVAIDILTDDALIEIFDFYSDDDFDAWHTLVHVCQRWRNVVFGSSRYLDLVLLCEPTTPVRESLHIWPPLPIVIFGDMGYPTSGLDNVIAALEHNDRISEVTLNDLSFWQLKEVAAAMNRPFPELTYLELHTDSILVPPLPNSFLGGSAPCLETLKLSCIQCPTLPNLHSSTPYLQSLHLFNVPYISPNKMLNCLSASTNLEDLSIEFYPFQPCPGGDWTTRQLRRRIRTFLPVLRRFSFVAIAGFSNYVEDLVAWIDAPLLESLIVNLFEEPESDTPQLVRLISRTPMFEAPIEVRVFFGDGVGGVVLPSSKRATGTEAVTFNITCRDLDRQLSWLAQICTSSLPPLLTVEHLYISDDGKPLLHSQDNIESAQWWDLLRPFTAVKKLYLSKLLAPRIAPALQELFRESATGVLPELQNIFSEDFQPSDPAETASWQFVSAKHINRHPIAVAHWDKELEKWGEDDRW